MAYPVPYARNYNFQQEADADVSEFPQPGKTDAELNDVATTVAQVRASLMAVTSADGRLRNVAYALAQSLVGTWTGTGAGSATIDTTIPWQATFSVNSLHVMVGTALLRPDQISSITSQGGNLRVVLVTAVTAGTAIVVWAFEPGNNVLTILGSAATGDGAARIAIEDAPGRFVAATVEAALLETATNLSALITALGALADYWKRDGSVVATADFDMGGFKITEAADGSDPGDYVTIRQLASYIAAWSDLSQFYMKRDGTTSMVGDLNYGNHKGVGLADADLTRPTDAVNVRTLQQAISVGGASPVGVIMDYIGLTAPTDWLFCDGSVYPEGDYPTLAALLPTVYKEGAAVGARAAFFPKLVAGNLTGGVITSLPVISDAGVGYTGPPQIVVVNPDDGGAAVVTQPTFNVTTVSGWGILTGPTVSAGVLVITLATGGAGIRAGATIRINDALAASPGNPALAQLPTGYIRLPDLRGRMTIGSGTESHTPGVIDPPDLGKGDAYNATPRAIGDFGGEEQHQLNIAEMPIHAHTEKHGGGGGSPYGTSDFQGLAEPTSSAGGDLPHNTMPPFHVLSKIIKAQ